MGIDLFTKRCGCGLVLKQRESCPKCADAQRARLHASGVAAHEEMPVLNTGGRSTKKLLDGWWKAAMTWYLADGDVAAGGLVYVDRPKPLPPTPVPVVEPPQECKNCCGAQHWDSAFGCKQCGSTWARYARAPKLPPPAIGEVVSWEVASADMKARPEARYRERKVGGVYDGYVGSRHSRFIQGVCWFGDPDSGGWECRNGSAQYATLQWKREA